MNNLFLINNIMRNDPAFVNYMNLKDIKIEKIDNIPDTSDYLTKIRYVNGIYFLLGSNGRLYRSSDTLTWTKCITNITTEINEIIYAKSLYVIIGANGKILTSPDAITWTARTSGVTNTLQSIAFGNSQFIAVGSPKVMLKSTDGITWTSVTFPTTNPTAGTVTQARIIYTGTEFLLFINMLVSTVDTPNVFYGTTGIAYTIITGHPMDILITSLSYQNGVIMLGSKTNIYKVINRVFYKLITNNLSVYSINYSQGLFLVGTNNKIFMIFENATLQRQSASLNYYSIHLGSSTNNRDIYGGLIVNKELVALNRLGYILRTPIYYK